jgi:hypothetical protein
VRPIIASDSIWTATVPARAYTSSLRAASRRFSAARALRSAIARSWEK